MKANIKKYLETSKKFSEIENVRKISIDNEAKKTTTGRKRTISSDDETQIQDPLYDPNAVIPVEPTFSKRTPRRSIDEDNDETKPWVMRGIAKAKARIQAHLDKLEARRLAQESRVKAPVQEAIVREIKEISDRIANLMQVKDMGLSTDETDFTLKKLIRQRKERSTELSLLKSKQRAGLRYRQRRKKHLETLCKADPEVATELAKLYKAPYIVVQSEDHISQDLICTMEEIATLGGVSCANPGFDFYRPCTTLEELRERIKQRHYEIRRAQNYYR